MRRLAAAERRARGRGGSGLLRGRRPGRAERRQAPAEVTTTRVQVVEGIGRRGGFDPRAIYERLAPGVVTVLSIFDGGGSSIGEEGAGGQGSGFVLDGQGYIATNAHVVTERGRARTAPSRCTWSSPTATAWRRRSSAWT